MYSTYPEIMHACFYCHTSGPLRRRIARKAIRDCKTDCASVRELQPQIVVDSSHRMVVLMDHEMRAMAMLIPFVEVTEGVHGYSWAVRHS